MNPTHYKIRWTCDTAKRKGYRLDTVIRVNDGQSRTDVASTVALQYGGENQRNFRFKKL
jgi:hypothetical protein